MTTQQLGLIAPLATPLPSPAEGEALTASQWITLMAIGDTVIPSIEVSSTPSPNKLALQASEYASSVEQIQSLVPAGSDSKLVHTYLAESASSLPELKALLHRFLIDSLRTDARKGLSLVLSALDTRAGCLVMTGSTTSFHLQPVHVRQQILQNWQLSYLPPLREAFKALTSMFKSFWLQTSPSLPSVIGFPRAPVHGKPGKGFDYQFLQFSAGDGPETIETDVVIIGSGCGGGVSAKNLAEAGHRVIVVEKGWNFPPEYLPMKESDAGVHLYQNGGMEVSDDSSMTIQAGQTWGGGGSINWSASLQTQGYVRQEWADGGLPFFTSSDFQNSLDRVCHRMGVSAEHIQHNKTNQVLLEGSRKLGYNAKVVPQNTGGKAHYCGYCGLGCGAAEKQGPVASFLPDAQRAGARFIEGFAADKVLFDTSSGEKVATGVQGTWRSRDSKGWVSGDGIETREVIIKAKRVIVSCGTLQSPLLLLRSGLTNPHIGRNLHLHPVSIFGAIYPERINPWEGAILTSVVDSFQDLDGAHHGVKLEALTMMPATFLALTPWTSGPEYKILASKFAHATAYISLNRERDTGRVYPDPVDGRCRIAYTPSPLTRKHVLEGIEALAKICYVSGASELITTTAGVPSFKRKDTTENAPSQGVNDPDFQAWLAVVHKKGLPSPDAVFASAHQMGTCRMGNTERNSVVGPDGRVWGTQGLYVADASVFPSASGVNPMVTNMATADWISQGIGRGLRLDGREARL